MFESFNEVIAKKIYHDNVRTTVRSHDLNRYDLNSELNTIVNNMMDNLTNYNPSDNIDAALKYLKKFQDDDGDSLGYELYDDIIEAVNDSINRELFQMLEDEGRINGGDYDIIMKGDEDDED